MDWVVQLIEVSMNNKFYLVISINLQKPKYISFHPRKIHALINKANTKHFKLIFAFIFRVAYWLTHILL